MIDLNTPYGSRQLGWFNNMKMFRKHDLLSVLRAGVDWVVRSPWRSFIFIFLLSFTIHVNQVNQIPSRYLIPDASRALGAIAISLMQTGQFANPYMIPTGPTAHLPPIIPFIISMITAGSDWDSQGVM